ncbi:MAG: Hsp70 family protein, partial [Fulvivirga sp.]
DSLIFQTEKQLKEYGDKLSDDNKSKINGALEELKKVHQAQEVDKIDAALETLNKAWEGAAQEMYAATGGQPGADAGAAAGAGDASQGTADSDVSDVEFEEVDDSSKK